MSRLAILACIAGVSAAFSSTAFAQEAAPTPTEGAAAPPTATTTTTAAPPVAADGTKAPSLVIVEPPPDTRPKQGLEKAPENEPVMFHQGLFGVLGGVNDSPFILPAATVADHFFVGLGASFAWTDNGSATGGLNSAANPPCTTAAACPGGSHKFAGMMDVALQYMLIDKLPFAIGPELQVIGSIAPDRFWSTIIFEPGAAFWYAPFRAPFVLGGAVDAQIITQNGTGAAKAQVTILTPGLRLGYIFN